MMSYYRYIIVFIDIFLSLNTVRDHTSDGTKINVVGHIAFKRIATLYSGLAHTILSFSLVSDLSDALLLASC